MLDAALALFVADGFRQTTMDAIARSAGVAVQTVYFTFGTKGELLQAVYEHVVLGPERIPPHQSTWWRLTVDAPDINAAVEALVEGTSHVLERAAPLVWAVLGDPTAREHYALNEQLRRRGNEDLVRILSAKHPLRVGLDPTTARDLLLVLTGPQLYSQFTRDLGWKPVDVQRWMTSAIKRELFHL